MRTLSVILFFGDKTQRPLQKTICGLAILFISFYANGQNSYSWKSNIDLIVQQADLLSMKSQNTFHLNKIYKNDRPVKETWHYTLHQGKVIIFEIVYVIDSTEFIEIYYVDRGKLVCSEQYEAPYYSDKEDDVEWGEVCFFVNNSLKQYVTLGNKKSRYITRFREFDSLRKFELRFSELQKNREAIE